MQLIDARSPEKKLKKKLSPKFYKLLNDLLKSDGGSSPQFQSSQFPFNKLSPQSLPSLPSLPNLPSLPSLPNLPSLPHSSGPQPQVVFMRLNRNNQNRSPFSSNGNGNSGNSGAESLFNQFITFPFRFVANLLDL